MPAPPEGYEEAACAFAANLSPRHMRLEALEKWAIGRQYDHLPNWWTGGEAEVPLFERCPCIVYPVVRVASGSNVDLVLGEGRFPTLTSKPGEDEQDLEGGLGGADSESLDRLIVEHHKLSRFRAHAREAFGAAQECGTAVGIHGHRDGKPFAELMPAKWCTPKLAVDRSALELEVRYPFLDERKIDGKWTVRAMLYRRVITPTNDITFKPALAREDGTEPGWEVDVDVPHNLGFCPVIWYPFMRGCAPVNQIDGNALHEHFRDEIHGLDLALSIHHRSMLNSEPQPVEIGVTPGHNPTGEQGRIAVVPSTERGGELGTPGAGAKTGSYLLGSTPSARKRGPGYIWTYPDEKTKVEYLAFPTGLLKEQEEYCDALLGKLEQSLAVVLPKPSQFKFAGAVSGKALMETKSRQHDRCDQYRDDFQEGFLVPSVNMQLRIAERIGTQLKVPGIAKALPVLKKFNAEQDSDAVASP